MTDTDAATTPADDTNFEWVPYEDPTDVDTTISFKDVNKIDASCSMYTAEAAASLSIEGIGDAKAETESSYMILDYVASRSKVVDGVAKAYGFGARVVVKMSGSSVSGSLDVTGVVANAHLGKIQTDVRMHVIGLSSPLIQLPKVKTLDIDGYAQLIALQGQIETILSLREPGVITLNPTVVAIRRSILPASDADLLRNSYSLCAMTGIQQGKPRDDWENYMLAGKQKISNPDLFKQVVAQIYAQNGISGNSKPSASQVAAAIEKTDGLYAERKAYN